MRCRPKCRISSKSTKHNWGSETSSSIPAHHVVQNVFLLTNATSRAIQWGGPLRIDATHVCTHTHTHYQLNYWSGQKCYVVFPCCLGANKTYFRFLGITSNLCPFDWLRLWAVAHALHCCYPMSLTLNFVHVYLLSSMIVYFGLCHVRLVEINSLMKSIRGVRNWFSYGGNQLFNAYKKQAF